MMTENGGPQSGSITLDWSGRSITHVNEAATPMRFRRQRLTLERRQP